MLSGASLMDADWKQAGAALVTGWSHGRPVEAWLAAVQLWVLDLDTLGLARLELTCGLDNVGSRRVAADVASPTKEYSSVAYVR